MSFVQFWHDLKSAEEKNQHEYEDKTFHTAVLHHSRKHIAMSGFVTGHISSKDEIPFPWRGVGFTSFLRVD